jgi:hypothetical protein
MERPAFAQTPSPDALARPGSVNTVVTASRIGGHSGGSVTTVNVLSQNSLDVLAVTHRDLFPLPNPDSVTHVCWKWVNRMRPADHEDFIASIAPLQGETGDISTNYVLWGSGVVEEIRLSRSGLLD